MLVVLLGLFACTESTETTYEQYNADDNAVTVAVGTTCDPSPCADVTVPLTSSSGEVEIGTGTVSPGGGPIGTVHTVRVALTDEFEADVDKAAVGTDSGKDETDEYPLEPDSADEGLWTLDIRSVGDVGAERSDTFTFRLYEAVITKDSGSVL